MTLQTNRGQSSQVRVPECDFLDSDRAAVHEKFLDNPPVSLYGLVLLATFLFVDDLLACGGAFHKDFSSWITTIMNLFGVQGFG
ncbi:hypothetical protein BDV12DRAFT_172615 [Aspergillus spectabilis]